MMPFKPYYKISMVILGCTFFCLPITCNAENGRSEGLFRNAQFDFSDYGPDPSSNDLYMVYHIIPSGFLDMDYHKSVYYFGMILSRYRGNIPGSSGYYLNRSKYHPHALRLTLFTRDDSTAEEIKYWIQDLEKNKLISIVPYVSGKVNNVIFSKEYGGDEYELRNYLTLYTPIGMECMGHNFNETQKIFHDLMTYGGTDITFIEHSQFFMRMTYEQRCRFIDAIYIRKWGHMIINFLLGYDESK